MKYTFSNIKDGSPIIIIMHSGSVHTRLNGSIINLIREDIATISLDTPTAQILKFDHTELEIIYIAESGDPYIWNNAKIVYFKDNYVLQIEGDGIKYNRRTTYRVNISQPAQLHTADDTIYQVIVKDVSLTGFSIVDTQDALHLSENDGITIVFEDLEHHIDLYGTVIRLEECEDSITYGCTIRRSCHDLPSYIATKLGDCRDTIPPSYII